LIIEQQTSSGSIDIEEFSISRFIEKDISEYWHTESLNQNSL
jgi:hypothetical protein